MSAMSVYADEAPSYRGCYVLHSNGTRTLINLSPSFSAGFNDNLELEFREFIEGNPDAYVILSVSHDDFAGVEFTQDVSSVGQLQQSQLRLVPARSALYIYGAAPGSTLAVCTAGGQILFTREINGDEVVNLEGKAPGVYLISVNSHTFKFFMQ